MVRIMTDLRQLLTDLIYQNFGADQLIGEDGLFYGREQSKVFRDSLDEFADKLVKKAADIAPLLRQDRPKVLDIGGASGHRAEQFVRLGANVLVVDIRDCAAEIAERNQTLGRPGIRFLHRDIRKVQPFELKNDWLLINIRQVLHWMKTDEIAELLSALPKICLKPAILVACTRNSVSTSRGSDPNFRNHKIDDVINLMTRAGYDILAAKDAPFIPGESTHQLYAAQIPSVR